MKSWPAPALPAIPGRGEHLRLYDTSRRAVGPIGAGHTTRMYVCGITPYDATHLGHAATYVTFDLVVRAMLDAGHEVDYVQNVTDVDDPLLERAARDGRDWRELATSEIDLFREDMTALGVIPPSEFLGVVESMREITDAVRRLVEGGAAYGVAVPEAEGGGEDVYLDLAQSSTFGEVSGWSRAEMEAVFPRRGGDPERPGKRDPLDPLLWRAARHGEPSWDCEVLGPGRPGWHIECTAISLAHLGQPFDIKGGGSDLVFPHHEMSAVQANALTGGEVFARHYVHQAMVGFQGEKMSKSKGNLVLVSALRHRGVEPMAIRLLLLGQHYRTEWEYTEELLDAAAARLDRWREALSVNAGAEAETTVAAIRSSIAADLDTASALAAVDAWADRTLAGAEDDPAAPGLVARAVDALLGVRL